MSAGMLLPYSTFPTELNTSIVCARCNAPSERVWWFRDPLFDTVKVAVECHGRRTSFTVDDFNIRLEAGQRLRDVFARRVFADERDPKKVSLSLLWGRSWRRRAA